MGYSPAEAVVFVDGTWLLHSILPWLNQAKEDHPGNDWRMDHGLLIDRIAGKLGREIGKDVKVKGVHFFTASFSNVHPQDVDKRAARDKIVSDLEGEANFTLHISELNLRQARLYEAKEKGEKVEKKVDVNMAVTMTQHLYGKSSCDWVVVVTGDLDLEPAMMAQKKGDRKVLLASMKNSCHKDYAEPRMFSKPYHKLFWLDDVMDGLIYTRRTTWMARTVEKVVRGAGLTATIGERAGLSSSLLLRSR